MEYRLHAINPCQQSYGSFLSVEFPRLAGHESLVAALTIVIRVVDDVVGNSSPSSVISSTSIDTRSHLSHNVRYGILDVLCNDLSDVRILVLWGFSRVTCRSSWGPFLKRKKFVLLKSCVTVEENLNLETYDLRITY